MIPYTVAEIAGITGGTTIHPEAAGERRIRYLSFDSRTILSGEETLFFALKSDRNDGHRYITDAISREVSAVVAEYIPESVSGNTGVTFIVVPDTLEAMQKLAATHRSRFSYPVVAITGSNGKTIVKEWLAELLGQTLRVVRSPRSYNSQLGNPLSVWLMDDQADLAIFEAGISRPGEMARLEQMLKPDHGIFTHLGNAHLENFSGVAELVSEKVKLFAGCSLVVYCRDFPVLDTALTELAEQNGMRLFSWSTGPDASLQVVSKEVRDGRTVLKTLFRGEPITLTIPFSDGAHQENAIHCLAYLLATGQEPGDFTEHFLHLPSVSMRLEIKKGINGCSIIDDSYNSDPASLLNALDFLEQQHDSRRLKSMLILSDLLQSGRNPDILYSEVAEYTRLHKVTSFIGIGPEITRYRHLFGAPETRFFPDTGTFLGQYREEDFRDSLILLKGARQFRFDRISSLLQEKKHQTVMEINLSALVHNLNHYRSLLNPTTRVMAMVKAFSYGTGSVEVARKLQYHRIDYLAVAIADEGIELRNAGIEVPIVVMNPELHSFDAMIENRLEPNIYKASLLHDFDEALRRNAVTDFPVHIKIDTGMKRLGFGTAGEIEWIIASVRERNTMFVRSVFTHLAVSEDDCRDDFTRRQFDLFKELSTPLVSAFGHKILLHILNSAGIERFPEMQLDMVRLGIGLYGVSNSQDQLKPVATLKSTISQIKTVMTGETVGYGRSFTAARPTRIAVIPIGYADGFSRRLGNGAGKVIIGGWPAPVAGTVCMDMLMVDVTDIPCREDDPVIIFGEEQPVSRVAEMMGTISYEVLTTVGQRVKRVYFEE